MEHFLANLNYLYSCPANVSDVGFPSITTSYGVLMMVALACVLYISIKRNKFVFEGTSISDNTISNNHWIGYMLFVCAWSFFNLLRFSLEKVTTQNGQLVLTIIPEILSCFMALFLSLALNHQRVYRTCIAPRVDESRGSSSGNYYSSGTYSNSMLDSESTSRSVSNDNERLSKNNFDSEETPPSYSEDYTTINLHSVKLSLTDYVLDILNKGLLCIYIEFTVAGTKFDSFFWWFYLIFIFIQRVPVIVLSFIIVSNANITEGPTIQSRVVLIIAIVITLFTDFPIPVWGRLFKDSSCSLFGIATYPDIVTLFKIASLPIFLIFISKEYTRLRNQNEIKWRFQAEIDTKQTTDYQWQNFGSRYQQ